MCWLKQGNDIKATNMKKVLYFISNFPNDNAPTQRVKAVSRLFETAGFEVCFAIKEPYSEEEVTKCNNHNLYIDERLCFRKEQRFSRNIERLSSSRIIVFARGLIEGIRPDIVLIYGGSYRFASQLLRLRNQYGFKLMADETDWFEPRLNPNFIQFFSDYSSSKRKSKLDIQFDAVISTSIFFDKYFTAQGVPSFFLPSVFQGNYRLDVEDQSWGSASIIQLVYAGNPHAHDEKDLLTPLLKAIDNLPKDFQKKLNLTIIGPSKNDLTKLVGTNVLKNKHIRITGKLSHQDVLKELETKHFGVLFRHNQLYAKAGFSTKFGECMVNGVPMICNKVGGADAFIQNWVNGVILPDAEPETIGSALRKICLLTPDELISMRKAAYSTANKYFVLDNYCQSFSDFLSFVLKNDI